MTETEFQTLWTAKYRLMTNPGNGWMSKMGWYGNERRKFREALLQSGHQILPDPPLHNYNLNKKGMERLSELEQFIQQEKDKDIEC